MINTMLEEGKWNDEDCSVLSMFICEKSAGDSDKGMSKVCQSVAYKAQDILSPDCRRKKKPSTPSIQKEYSDDGLLSSWIQYNQTVRCR